MQIKRYLLAHTTSAGNEESLLNSFNGRMKSWDISSDCLSNEEQDESDATPPPSVLKKQTPSPTASVNNLLEPPKEAQTPQKPRKPQEPLKRCKPEVEEAAECSGRARRSKRKSISKLKRVISVKHLGDLAGEEGEQAW